MRKATVLEGRVYVRPCERGILLDSADLMEQIERVLFEWGVPCDGRDGDVCLRVSLEIVPSVDRGSK